MADPILVARLRGEVVRRFDAVASLLADRLGIKLPASLSPTASRDPELKRVRELEGVVGYLESLANVTAHPEFAKALEATKSGKAKEPASPEQPRASAPKVEPEKVKPAADKKK